MGDISWDLSGDNEFGDGESSWGDILGGLWMGFFWEDRTGKRKCLVPCNRGDCHCTVYVICYVLLYIISNLRCENRPVNRSDRRETGLEMTWFRNGFR